MLYWKFYLVINHLKDWLNILNSSIFDFSLFFNLIKNEFDTIIRPIQVARHTNCDNLHVKFDLSLHSFPIFQKILEHLISRLLYSMAFDGNDPTVLKSSKPGSGKNRKSYHLRWMIRGGRIFMRQFHKNGYWVWRAWDIPILFENADLLYIRFLGNWFKG